MKDATPCDATVGVAADCNDILAFLQAVALKLLRVMAAPLSLRADLRATSWFYQWLGKNLIQKTIHKTTPQDHSVLTKVLSEVLMRL